MMHLEFSGLSVTPEVLTAPRRMIVAPSLENLSNVSTPTPPKCIPVEPSYNDEARRAHIQGPVTLDVVIRSNGAIEVIKVLTSLGYGLDEEAIAVLAKWKCTPGTVNGQPVNIRLKIVVNFHLN
jgi:TonB family protein